MAGVSGWQPARPKLRVRRSAAEQLSSAWLGPGHCPRASPRPTGRPQGPAHPPATSVWDTSRRPGAGSWRGRDSAVPGSPLAAETEQRADRGPGLPLGCADACPPGSRGAGADRACPWAQIEAFGD